MNMSENANLIEGLRLLGFTDTQIADFILAVEGRISLEEMKKRHDAEDKGGKSGN